MSSSRHSGGHSSSSSRRYPPVSGTSRPSGSGRRSSLSSGSDRERGVFSMSGSDRSSSSAASSHRSRRSSVSASASTDVAGLARGIGNSLSLRDDDRHRSSSGSGGRSTSSGSWQPQTTSAAAPPGGSRFFGGGSSSDPSSSNRQPSSRHTGSGSGSGSLFESRGSGAAMDIPLGTGGRREIVNPSSNYPGSGHSDRFKSRNEASTGQSYDSWKSNASTRDKYNAIKSGEESWQGRARGYEQRLDNTPSDRGGRGESYDSIAKNLSRSQHERYGRDAHDTMSSISRTADRRVEMNQDHSKEQLKKGLMTGYNTLGGHNTRVGILEGEEDRYRRKAEKHYDYAESSRRGLATADLERSRDARESRTPRPQRGPEPTAYEYGDRLRRDGRATEDQLRAAGWGSSNGKYDRDSTRRER